MKHVLSLCIPGAFILVGGILGITLIVWLAQLIFPGVVVWLELFAWVGFLFCLGKALK